MNSYIQSRPFVWLTTIMVLLQILHIKLHDQGWRPDALKFCTILSAGVLIAWMINHLIFTRSFPGIAFFRFLGFARVPGSALYPGYKSLLCLILYALMISFNAQLHLKTHHQLSDASLEETTRDITIGVIRHEKGPYAHSIIGWYPVGAGFQKAKFKVALEKLPLQCHYGDRITGRFSIGPIYRWKSRYFDAPNQFLRREHIYLEGRFKGDSLTIRPAPGFNLLHHSQRIAHHLQLTILQSISDVEIAQLLTSLLIGIKTNLDQEIKQSFIRSGTAHILAVSGLHLGMIYVLITTLINWIPIRLIRSSRPARCIIILVLIWAFALLTGMGASVIRAAVMLSLGLLGSLFKRRSDAVNTLFACAFLMLCNNPCRMFDIGFQLSFFAVLSILMFQPFVSRIWTPTTPVLIKLRDLLAISLSVQILITPVSLYYFHQFPTAFLLANLIWIPLSFVLMILTILIATVYMIFGEPIGLLSDLTSCLTKTGLRILNELNTLPNATLENLWISNSQLIGSTLCFVLLYFWLRKAAKYILQTILCIWLITGLLYPLRLKQIQTSRECILFHEKGRLQAAIRNGRKIHTTLPDSRALRTYRIAHFIQFEEPANMNEIRSFLSDNPPNEAKDSPYRNPEDDKRPFMEPENNNTDLVQRGISNTLMKYPAYPFLAKKDFLQKGPAIIALSNHD